MSVATDRQLNEITEWLRADMIQTGDRRYIEFIERSPTAQIHPCLMNNSAVGFVMIDGHRIAMVAFKAGEERWMSFMADGLVGWASGVNFAALSVSEADVDKRAFLAARGFVPVSDDAMVIDLRGDIDLAPFTGERTEFSIRFYSEEYPYRIRAEPYSVTEGVGILTDLKELHLPRRAISIQQASIPSAPPSMTAIEIEVGGELVMRSHMRDNRIQMMGAKLDRAGTVYFERIDLFTYQHVASKAQSWLSDV